MVEKVAPVLPPIILDRLRERGPSCFLCKWILGAHEKEGKMAGACLDFVGATGFPVESQLLHLKLEFPDLSQKQKPR